MSWLSDRLGGGGFGWLSDRWGGGPSTTDLLLPGLSATTAGSEAVANSLFPMPEMPDGPTGTPPAPPAADGSEAADARRRAYRRGTRGRAATMLTGGLGDTSLPMLSSTLLLGR